MTDALTRLRALADLATPHVLRTAVTLGVAEAIEAGHRTVPDLARAVGAHEGALGALVQHLVDEDVLTRGDAGELGLTEVGALLTGPVRRVLDLEGAAGRIDRAWPGLVHAVRTGEAGFPTVFGAPFWDVINADPALAASFDAYISTGTHEWAPAVVGHLDDVGVTSVADVGGGNGTFLAAALADAPERTGVVVELAASAAAATALLAERGLGGRGRSVVADMREQVPGGHDAYVLAQVLHDWPDPDAEQILRGCARAAGSDGRVVLVERLADGGGHAVMSLMMRNLFGASERTLADLTELAERTGLRVAGTRPVSAHLHLLDLVPA